jgi:hypothetical protein
MKVRNHENHTLTAPQRAAWNKGKLIGAKPPLRPKHVTGRVQKIFTQVTGKKHPKSPRFSTLFKGRARDPKIPSCIY